MKRGSMGKFALCVPIALAFALPALVCADPIVFTEGVVEILSGTTTAGDIVACDFGITCDNTTPTSQWSDVLVFYNPENGPFVSDSSQDATDAYIYSNDTDLATFLANYNTGINGQDGLSSNVVFFNEDATGQCCTGLIGYSFNSPNTEPSAVPEPRALIPLGIILASLALFRKRFLPKH